MADIELVIKIDEEDYKEVLEINDRECEWNNMHRCYEAVLQGIVLPKGHGRLIDADALKISENYDGIDAMNAVYSASTIIEADKMESEDKAE